MGIARLRRFVAVGVVVVGVVEVGVGGFVGEARTVALEIDDSEIPPYLGRKAVSPTP